MTMRVSDIANWTTCETMALHGPPREGRMNVAAWVGTLAHAILAGLPEPERPDRLAFDATTPTEHVATIQARNIARCARKLLSQQGWGVLSKEEAMRRGGLTGHLDIRAWRTDMGEAIIDLKTGGTLGAAWLQVGGYISLSEAPVQYGGVLHVPRQRVDRDTIGRLEIREAAGLLEAWRDAEDRVFEVQHGKLPTLSPGFHCSRCQVPFCAVRVGGG